MTSAAIALALGIGGPLLAYVAHSYDPPKTSIFVCDTSGQARAIVASPAKEPYAVLWAGPSRLVWLSPGTDGVDEVWTSPWPNPAPRKLGEYKGVAPWKSQPGIPYLSYEGGGASEWFTVTPGGELKASDPPVDPYAALSSVVTSKDGKHEFRIMDSVDVAVVQLSDGSGQTKTLELNLNQVRWDSTHDRLWIRTMRHDSTVGNRFALSTVDWGSMSLTPRIADYAQADFWPGRDLTAFCPPSILAKVGKKKQWVAALFCGNIRTGQFSKVVSGAIEVRCVAIQP
ncbi:MAG: hypothetical protein JSS66_17215 [Armatimonadetes bacterium]|nr:hypothetical protein [Armatimonadota bacterium]